MAFPTFEQRRDVIHAGIADGSIGCGFGKHAARRGAISYVPAPGPEDDPDEYAQAMADFAYGDAQILIAVNQEDPSDFACGRDRAYEIYQATLLAACRMERAAVASLLRYEQHMEPDAVTQLRQIDREAATRMFHGPAWMAQPGNRELMDDMFMVEGPAALSVLHAQTGSHRRLMAFTMAPYYKPLREGHAHPRFSPHMAVVLNYTQDVLDVAVQQANIAAVRRWVMDAVGYAYKQGFHIPQIPVPMDAAKALWRPQD